MAFFSAATSNISKSRLLLRLLQYSEKDRERERERLVLRRANNSIHSNPHDWCPLASVGKREKCFGKSSRCLIRGLVRNTKCVSQTHKTWFYYDYTTRHDKPGEARTNKQHKVHIIIWWSNFLQKKNLAKDVFIVVFIRYCCLVRVLVRVRSEKNSPLPALRDEIWFQLYRHRAEQYRVACARRAEKSLRFFALWFAETKLIIN